MTDYINFNFITPCGESCVACPKKGSGFCEGCIESDGYCKEWTQSQGCPIYNSAKHHSVMFCGLCNEFPCTFLTEKVKWNANIVQHHINLAKIYKRVK